MNRYLAMGFALVFFMPAAPVTASTLDYDCDSPGGRVSELKATQSGSVNSISGVLTARNMTSFPDWGAVGNARLQSADGKNFIMLRLAGWPQTDTQTLRVSIMLRISGQDEEIVIGKTTLLQPVAFSISVDASGSAAISFAGVQRTAIIALGEAPVASVSCSTGEFVFGKLELGN